MGGDAAAHAEAAVRERVPSPYPEGSAPDWFEVEYTVDRDLEVRIRSLLAEKEVGLAHVILMDPSSGRLLAYVSTDPEALPPTRAYPTASLMKVVTAAAVLRHAPQAVRRTCRYAGSPWDLRLADLRASGRRDRVHSFQRALALSNNQCFARFAVQDLGREPLLAEMERLGFTEPPAPMHAAGRVEPIRSDLSLGHLGSGLAGSFLTPLGAARLAAALAHGRGVEPRWIARVRDARGEPVALPPRPAPRRVWPHHVAEGLRETLVSVTESGTARRAFRGPQGEPRLGPVRVAGKTGTLSGTEPAGRYQWFIGVAPAATPRVALATLVVSNPPGGPSASEVAASTLSEVFCADGRCGPEAVELLYARSEARTQHAERELAERAARGERRLAEAEAQLAALRDAERRLRAAAELDRMPRPVEATRFDFPRRLRSREAQGEIVLLLDLNSEGEVLDVRIDSSELPDFDAYVSRAVRGWRFTPPTRYGRPVRATARFPIAIDIH